MSLPKRNQKVVCLICGSTKRGQKARLTTSWQEIELYDVESAYICPPCIAYIDYPLREIIAKDFYPDGRKWFIGADLSVLEIHLVNIAYTT